MITYVCKNCKNWFKVSKYAEWVRFCPCCKNHRIEVKK